MHIELIKKINVYFIVPNDISNKVAYLTHNKNAKIIGIIFVVINTDVINRQIWNFNSVYDA